MLCKLITAAALAMAISAPSAAHADPVNDTRGGVYVKRVSTAPAGPAITVTLSNGKREQLTPCRFEDGRHCYWDAGTAGNGIGNSFLVMSGVRFYVDLSWIGGTR